MGSIAKNSTTKDKRLILASTLGVLLFCGFGAFVYFLLSTPPKPLGPPLYPDLPVYSGATDVVVQRGDTLEHVPTLERERLVRFKTGDTAQQVLQFYEETLTKAGWSLFEKISPDQRSFYWTDGSIATGLYRTNVSTTPLSGGVIEVTLETGVATDVDTR